MIGFAGRESRGVGQRKRASCPWAQKAGASMASLLRIVGSGPRLEDGVFCRWRRARRVLRTRPSAIRTHELATTQTTSPPFPLVLTAPTCLTTKNRPRFADDCLHRFNIISFALCRSRT